MNMRIIKMRRPVVLVLLVAAVLMVSGFTLNLNRIAKALKTTVKAARPMSDREEYYLGRAVAAGILSDYRLIDDDELTGYLNLVGRAVAMSSEKPYTYGGYHFAVLDAEVPNAFACPGGIIFITTGMLSTAGTEDELAAILAHEIAHVNHRDGVNAIKKSRWLEVASLIGQEVAQMDDDSERLSMLSTMLDGSVQDVLKTMMQKGYSREQEHKADAAAAGYLLNAGYDPAALKTFIQKLGKAGKEKKGLKGIFATHPSTRSRLKSLKEKMPASESDPASVRLRAERFSAALM